MEKFRFLISGSGGQGIITMAILLAEAAAIHEGLFAVQSQVYGPEARGGATRSDVIISNEPILFPKVTQPGVLVTLNQSSFSRYGETVRPGGLMITDGHLVQTPADLDVRHVSLPFHDAVTQKFGNPQGLNICVLGAIIALTNVVRPHALQMVLAARFPHAEKINMEAFNLGQKMVENIQ